MARHDPARTGMATGTSDLRAPARYWSYYLGGQLNSFVAQTDSQGRPLLYMAYGGVVTAKGPNDQLVWRTPPLGLSSLVGLYDLDGDGQNELVATASAGAVVLDASTGAIKWREPAGEMGVLALVLVADLDGDHRPDLVIQECGQCGVSSMNSGFVYSFGGGYDHAVQRFALPAETRSYVSTVPADIDDDGKMELLVSHYDGFSLLSGSDGTELARSPSLWAVAGRSSCRFIQAGGDRYFACLENHIPTTNTTTPTRRVFLLRYDAAAPVKLALVWDLTIAPNMGGDVASAPDFVADLLGDGGFQFVVSTNDGTGWTTQILDGRTGATIAQLAGEIFGGTIDLRAGTPPYLLTTGAGKLTGWTISGAGASPTMAFRLASVTPALVPALPGRAAGLAPSRVATLDLDGDGQDELIVRMGSQLLGYAVGGATPTQVATYMPGSSVGIAGLWLAPPLLRPYPQLVMAGTDGVLRLLDRTLTPVPGDLDRPRDVRTGGYYAAGAWRDLWSVPVVGRLGSEMDAILVDDSRHRLQRIDAQVASLAIPPIASWSLPDVTSPVVLSNTQQVGAVLGGSILVLLDSTGQTVWKTPAQGTILNDIVPGDLDGDGVIDFAFQWGAKTDLLLHTEGRSGKAGKLLWEAAPYDPGAGRQPAGIAVADFDGDGKPEVFQVGAAELYVQSGMTGAVVESAPVPGTSYDQPTVFDVDHDGKPEVALQGGFVPLRLYGHDLTPRFIDTHDDRPYPYAAVAACDGGRTVLVAGSLLHPAQVRMLDLSGSTAGTSRSLVAASGTLYDDEFAARDALAGQLTSITVHANLTGEGHPSALFGSSDGYLYAIDPCSGELDFALNFGVAVGEAVFGDTDGDGKDEVLVTAGDGYLYGIKNSPVAAPTGVRIVDPMHPDMGPADITLGQGVGVTVRWDAVDRATGYEVALVSDAGVASSPTWQRTTGTQAIVTTVPIVDGRRYRAAVRAIVSTGASVDSVGADVTLHLSAAGGSGGAAGGGPADGGGGAAGGSPASEGSDSGGGVGDGIMAGAGGAPSPHANARMSTGCTVAAGDAAPCDGFGWLVLPIAAAWGSRRRLIHSPGSVPAE
jgi:hypothetical protein